MSGLAGAVGRTYLKLTGWRVEGALPALDKFVLIGAPHTSNWDFVYLLAVSLQQGVFVRWIGKHTLFRPPFGALMRALGGVPIDRRAHQGLVDRLVEEFGRHDKFVLTVPPEGTRGYSDAWRSGFYRIAQAAHVPIVPGGIDYPRKVVTFGPPLYPTGDLHADMDVLRAFYADKVGKFPADKGEVRLKGEDAPE